MDWSKLTIAIVAGDRREQEIARQAAATGAKVRAYGFPWPEKGIEGVTLAPDAKSALKGAQIALFPIPGIAADGALFAPGNATRIIPDREMLSAMAKPGHIVLGWADKNLADHGKALGITFHEYETDKELMLLRAPAIIEGLIRSVVEHTDTTIHRSRVCIVGQGSIGFLLTRYMVALGAYTHVVARNPTQRAAAQAHGAESHPLEELAALAPTIDIVVSTVAAPVIPASVIAHFPKHTLLVDLAAPPGGIDREAAAARGLKFVWARGLGSRAPVTVGRSQWAGIKRRIEEFMEKAA